VLLRGCTSSSIFPMPNTAFNVITISQLSASFRKLVYQELSNNTASVATTTFLAWEIWFPMMEPWIKENIWMTLIIMHSGDKLIGESFILQQDNAPCHKTKLITKFLKDVGVNTLHSANLSRSRKETFRKFKPYGRKFPYIISTAWYSLYLNVSKKW